MSSDEDYHPPLSPPRTAELLFGLGETLGTDNISAAALAQQIRSSDRVSDSIFGGGTTYTDDFLTAVEPSTAKSTFVDASYVTNLYAPRKPPSDILTTTFVSGNIPDDLSTDSGLIIDDETPTLRLRDNHDNTIDDIRTLSNIPESTEEADISMSATTVASSETMHIDAAEKVYDGAKGIWAWGKGVSVLSPFLGIAEGAASKIVTTAASGETLESVDRHVIDHIQGLDDKYLNPAISFIVQLVLSAAGNTEETMKPFIIKILTPFGLIKNTAECPELTPVPGVVVNEI
jgi:hypothetical protein